MGSSYASFGSTPQPGWRDLYLQALFETDTSKAGARIAEAERALIHRECELFAEPHDPAERDAVNTALHALRALRSCFGIHQSSLAA